MQFLNYLKERGYQLVVLFLVVLTIETLLFTVRGGAVIQIYVLFVLNMAYFLSAWYEYCKEKKYFQEIFQFLDTLDKKYLLCEMMPSGENMEQRLIREILSETEKSMADYVNFYKMSNNEYKEYIEMWIHEVKIPIATGKMIVENHKNSVTESIDEELSRIYEYTEQALFYARSNYVEKDYMIKRICLCDVLNQVVLKNKKSLIQKRAAINLHDLDQEVLSDSKWLAFIINQIISNSIKYCNKEKLELEIYACTREANTELYVKDNGMGIRKEELDKVFLKGFTGTNGRLSSSKSTGIGLYLCKKLCLKLKHGIEIDNGPEEGCVVKLIFPKSSFVDLED